MGTTPPTWPSSWAAPSVAGRRSLRRLSGGASRRHQRRSTSRRRRRRPARSSCNRTRGGGWPRGPASHVQAAPAPRRPRGRGPGARGGRRRVRRTGSTPAGWSSSGSTARPSPAGSCATRVDSPRAPALTDQCGAGPRRHPLHRPRLDPRAAARRPARRPARRSSTRSTRCDRSSSSGRGGWPGTATAGRAGARSTATSGWATCWSTRDGLRAVLDWELAHAGDPAEDIGWLCARAWRFGGAGRVGGFGDLDRFLAAYAAAGGRRRRRRTGSGGGRRTPTRQMGGHLPAAGVDPPERGHPLGGAGRHRPPGLRERVGPARPARVRARRRRRRRRQPRPHRRRPRRSDARRPPSSSRRSASSSSAESPGRP